MITILDIARHRGVQEDDNGSIPAEEFDRVGLPFMGGCISCGAVIASYNAVPNRSGFISCASDSCASSPFTSVAEFENFFSANSH